MSLENCSPNLADVSREQLEAWYLFHTSVLTFMLLRAGGEYTIHPSDIDALPTMRRITVEDREDGCMTIRCELAK